jgi:FkbM family methyltransferase
MTSTFDAAKRLVIAVLPAPMLRPIRHLRHWHVFSADGTLGEADLRVAVHLAEAGKVALDIGANIGIYTKALSDVVGPEGLVVSIEPITETFTTLRRNVERSRLSNVVLLNAAASDRGRIAVMEIPRFAAGHENFYQARIVEHRDAARGAAVVPAVPLDSLLELREDVVFVKCDVEGHELQCLMGAPRLLHDVRPSWLIEVSGMPDVPGTNAFAVFELMAGAGYQAWVYGAAGLQLRGDGIRSTNYFFLTDSHAATLRARAPHLFA